MNEISDNNNTNTLPLLQLLIHNKVINNKNSSHIHKSLIQLHEKSINTKYKQFIKKQLQNILNTTSYTSHHQTIYHLLQKQISTSDKLVTKILTSCNNILQEIIINQEQSKMNNHINKISINNKIQDKIVTKILCYMKLMNKYYIINDCFIIKKIINQSNQSEYIDWYNINVIISEFSLSAILSYVLLCLHYSKVIKLITTTDLWNQSIHPILYLFWGQCVSQIWMYGNNLLLYNPGKATLFDYENSYIAFKKRFWYSLSYDIILIFSNGDKCLLTSKGIRTEEQLYTAWRRDILSEEQYCQYLDKVLTINTSTIIDLLEFDTKNKKMIKQQTKNGSMSIQKYPLKTDELISILKEVEILYGIFSDSWLFCFIPQELKQQIYGNGIIVNYNKGSIVYKQLSNNPDKFYLILKGKCSLTQGESTRMLVAGDFFNIQTLIQNDNKNKNINKGRSTLEVVQSKSFIFSISLDILIYLLGHFQPIIQKIYKIDLSCNNNVPIGKSISLMELQIDEWIIKCIIQDSQVNKNSSKKFQYTKFLVLSKGNLGLSTEIWRKLVYKNIKFLLATEIIAGK